MKEKAIRQSFIFALSTSTFALLISVIAVPLLQADLEHLKSDVLSDMDGFKEATDALWNELLQIERDSAVVKRDISLVYSYRPFVHRKSKPPPQRVYGQTIINKSGREVFTDAELIGLPGERKSGSKFYNYLLPCSQTSSMS
ncbi:nematode cuticle collagen domain protein [Oesophagostomum dentatum]|uniref:Nematode cuticle collagen domain protein n=1 Tax=Oesophagostomum dentatum TaxID=61180 RepID=A0A0B1SPA9_OESDE|nr:nematode cuticle collagen domain protein [Oesophagostomum dentatum]